MQLNKSEWFGYERFDFDFEGRNAIVVVPEKKYKTDKWLFKTEYFGAFPQFELEMLKRGYSVAYASNITRWCMKEDIDFKPRFCDFISKEFKLRKQCMTVGMSCGGMHSVYFAAKYPEYVTALYLDAPVLNLLSCPCGVGIGGTEMYEEFKNATGVTVSDLINYRHHPIDYVPELIREKKPVFLICGDSDRTVPYCENGALLAKQYRESDVPFFEIIKKGCDHHPHGLEDCTPLIEFAQKYY